MTDQVYYFIATKTSADFTVPTAQPSQAEFNRKVKGAFSGLIGGVLRAGDIRIRPSQNAIANHVLCDGATYNPKQFPDLFREIGTDFGGDGVTTFAVPNLTGGPVAAATPTEPQIVTDGGTVSTGEPAPSTGGQTGGTTGGNVPSGGRPIRDNGVPEN